MKIYVDLDHVDITEYTQIESGEYNTNKINFIFTPEYKDLVKVAIFGCKLDTDEPKFYKIYLSDDSCYLPLEVTTTSDVISIGVYAFNVDNGELKLRYSPTPVKTIVYEGSFREEAENASSPTPTEIEQIMSRIISLEEITSDLNTRVEALENKACDLDNIKEDVETLKSDVEGISGRLDTAESDIDELEGDIANTYSKTEVDTLLGSKVDTTTFNSSQAAQDEKIAKAELILSQLPKVTGEGTTISLSPTIEYDLEVGSLKGDTYQETLTGKNLYVGSQDFSGTWNNENLWDDVTEKYNGLVVKKKASQWSGLSKDIELEVGTYTFSVYAKSDTSRACSFYIGGGTANIYPTSATANITTTWTRYYMTFNVTSAGTIKARIENTTDGGTTNYTYICGYQLETGSSMTDYEPYCGGIPSPNPNYPQDIQVVTGTQTVTISNADNTESQTYTLHLGDLELAKIGNYQDKIYYDNGKWYKYGAIGKVIYNGSEAWEQNTTTLGYRYRVTQGEIKPNADNNTIASIYSNYFRATSPDRLFNNDNYSISNFSGTSRVIIIACIDSNTDTLEKWKTWLSTHNTTVYYVLATASSTEITNETLLSDLEYIRTHAMSYSGTTNISSSGNLPVIISASAIKQLS